MNYEDILYDVRNGAAWITINRPEKMNAFRGKTCDELIHAINRAGYDPKIGVVDRLRSGIVNDMFRTFYVKDRPFRVSDKCIGCGKCAKLCPVGCIEVKVRADA